MIGAKLLVNIFETGGQTAERATDGDAGAPR